MKTYRVFIYEEPYETEIEAENKQDAINKIREENCWAWDIKIEEISENN